MCSVYSGRTAYRPHASKNANGADPLAISAKNTESVPRISQAKSFV